MIKLDQKNQNTKIPDQNFQLFLLPNIFTLCFFILFWMFPFFICKGSFFNHNWCEIICAIFSNMKMQKHNRKMRFQNHLMQKQLLLKTGLKTEWFCISLVCFQHFSFPRFQTTSIEEKKPLPKDFGAVAGKDCNFSRLQVNLTSLTSENLTLWHGFATSHLLLPKDT